MTLKQWLVEGLKRRNDWVASGHIQRAVAAKTKYTAQNAGRRLRELENEGVVEVEYRANHAYYRIAQKNRSTAIVERNRGNSNCTCDLCQWLSV